MAYRAAIIGFGGMGSWHAKSIREKVERIEVTGAYDIRPEACEKAREAGLKVYASLEDLLCDPDIDLVTVATPNNFHKGYVLQCLRAGKHVVCEKPVTMNAAELEEIMEVAKQTGRLFSIHQNRRWDKDFCVVKEAVRQGLLGNVYFVESKVQGSRGAMHGWRGYKVNGGGMVLDWGVHLIDQALNLLEGPVVSVDAHLLSVFTPEVEDNIKILLRFLGGCSVLLEMSTNCFIRSPRWHVTGTEGTLKIDDWSAEGKIVRLKTEGEMVWEDDIVYTEAGPTRTMAPRPAHTTLEVPLPSVMTDWSDYYNNIADVLDGKAELIVKPHQALRVMRIIDLVFDSATKGCG